MSARIYSALLSLYPADLRHEFGAEMTQVFLDDLEDSRRVHGFRGAARVWWRSLNELFRIGLPLQASKREIAVPIVMYVLQEIYLGAIILLAPFDPSMPIWPKTAGQRLVLLFIPCLIPAVIASVALRIGNRSVPVPLELSRIGLTHK